jgi:hypothetical protein
LVHSVSINLDPSQFSAGWRPANRTLFLPTLSESRVGDQVAVRVGIIGQAIRATLFGKVSLVRRVGRPALPPGIELQLDHASLPAAGFLAMAARGETVTFKERSPRFAVERRVTIRHAKTWERVATLNLSEGGCSVRWPGPLPLVGDVVSVRLAEGLFEPTGRGIICWNQPGTEQQRTVGLRVIVEGRFGKAWTAMISEVIGSGARTA